MAGRHSTVVVRRTDWVLGSSVITSSLAVAKKLRDYVPHGREPIGSREIGPMPTAVMEDSAQLLLAFWRQLVEPSPHTNSSVGRLEALHVRLPVRDIVVLRGALSSLVVPSVLDTPVTIIVHPVGRPGHSHVLIGVRRYV